MGGSRRPLGGVGGARRPLDGLGGSRRPLGGLGGSRRPAQKCHVKNKDIRKFLDGIFVSEKKMIPISPRKFHIRINGGLLLLLGNGTGSAHIWWIKHPHKILPCRRTQSNCLRRLPRHVMAMVLVGPFAYVLERRKQRPSLSFSVAAKIFVLALFGTTIYLSVYYAGLAYTSPTVACALSNVIPSLTFLMAVLLGLEKLKIRTARGQAKVAAHFSALVVLLFSLSGKEDTYLKAVVSKVYTARLSLTTMICFFALLQSSFLDLFFARNPISWRLEWNLQLSIIAYCFDLKTSQQNM
ncbi:unnamed protein product [Prunus armeniaca]